MRRALGVTEGARGPRHRNAARELANLAGLCAETGNLKTDRLDEATGLLERARKIRRAALGPRHWLSAGCDCDLAKIRRKQGRLEEAEGLLRGALGPLGRPSTPPTPSPPLPPSRPAPAPPRPRHPPRPAPARHPPRPAPPLAKSLGDVLRARGRLAEAEATYKKLAAQKLASEVAAPRPPLQPSIALGQPAAPPRPKIPARPALSRPAPPRAERVLALAAQLQLQARFDEAEELLRVRPRGI
eukprot:tig00001001_g6196.t1